MGSALECVITEGVGYTHMAIQGAGYVTIVVGLLASALPAYRASRTDPMKTLRVDT